jgi:Skp family chaperone for outer membrane proteins
MNKKHFALICVTTLCSAAPTSVPQTIKTVETKRIETVNPMRTVYVDPYAIMQESTEGRKVAQLLESKRKNFSDEINRRGKKLEQEVNEYRAKQTTMSESARAQEEQRLAKAERDYKGYIEECEQEFKVTVAQQTESFSKKLEESAEKIGRENNLYAIVDRTNGRPFYVAKDADFTDKMIVKIDETVTKSTKLAKAA